MRRRGRARRGCCVTGSVQNGIFSGLDWLPTFVAAAGNPNITDELLKGKTIGGQTYKNHLDGYNQTAAITGEGPSARHDATASAPRIRIFARLRSRGSLGIILLSWRRRGRRVEVGYARSILRRSPRTTPSFSRS